MIKESEEEKERVRNEFTRIEVYVQSLESQLKKIADERDYIRETFDIEKKELQA